MSARPNIILKLPNLWSDPAAQCRKADLPARLAQRDRFDLQRCCGA